jgi:hypothetical protein
MAAARCCDTLVNIQQATLCHILDDGIFTVMAMRTSYLTEQFIFLDLSTIRVTQLHSLPNSGFLLISFLMKMFLPVGTLV